MAHLNWHLSRDSHSSEAPDGPADVEALGERVREAARSIGERVRAGAAVPGFVAPDESDPNHHLWKNGGRWWIAFTAHAGVAQERVRFSLGTTDVAVARSRRDAVLRLFAEAEGLAISLRFTPSRRPGTTPSTQRENEPQERSKPFPYPRAKPTAGSFTLIGFGHGFRRLPQTKPGKGT